MTVEGIFLGLVVSVLFSELAGLSPGGLIVPAYIAAFVGQPLRILGTLLAALLSLGCFAGLSRVFLIYGRRRFLLLVLMGAVWAMAIYRLAPRLWPASIELRSVGWVIPGLLANAAERQGVWKTLAATAIASSAAYFLTVGIMHLMS